MKTTFVAVAAVALLLFPPVEPAAGRTVGIVATCDASLWSRVYSPKRLVVVNACIEATGVIVESDANEDGDQHFLLKLDPGQDRLLSKRNVKKKGGALVIEIVCANPAKPKKAKKACAGYTNPIAIPAIGAHVRVSGSYVTDTHNNWMEIHPVSKVELMR